MSKTMRLFLSFSVLVSFALFESLCEADAQVATQHSDFGPQKAPLEAETFHLGSMHVQSLHDAQNVVPNDSKIFGANATPKDVAAVLRAQGIPTDRITLSINVLYAKNGERRYLFDTGLPSAMNGNLLENLAAHHIEPDTITDIFITHSHPDHVGGLLTANGDYAFPHATVHMTSKEWAFMQSNEKEAMIVKQIFSHVKVFDGTAKLAPGVTAFPSPGHTPGHSGYLLTSDGQSLLDIGDMAHSSVISLARPDWVMGFDADASTGEATRTTLLGKFAKAHTEIFAPHFPFPGVGFIAAAGRGYAWHPAKPE